MVLIRAFSQYRKHFFFDSPCGVFFNKLRKNRHHDIAVGPEEIENFVKHVEKHICVSVETLLFGLYGFTEEILRLGTISEKPASM